MRKRILSGTESDITRCGQSLTHDNFNFFPYSHCSIFLEYLCLILHHIVSRKVSSDSFFNPITCVRAHTHTQGAQGIPIGKNGCEVASYHGSSYLSIHSDFFLQQCSVAFMAPIHKVTLCFIKGR